MCRWDGLAVHVVWRFLLCLGVLFRSNVTHILVDLGLDLDAAHLRTGYWDLLGLEGAASAGGAALGQLAVDDVRSLVQLNGLQGDSVLVLVVLCLRLLLGLHDGVQVVAALGSNQRLAAVHGYVRGEHLVVLGSRGTGGCVQALATGHGRGEYNLMTLITGR